MGPCGTRPRGQVSDSPASQGAPTPHSALLWVGCPEPSPRCRPVCSVNTGPLCSGLMSVFNPKPQRRIPSFMPRGVARPRPWDCGQRPVHESSTQDTAALVQLPGPSLRPSRPAEEEEEVTSRQAEDLGSTPCMSQLGRLTASSRSPSTSLSTCVLVSSAPTRASEAVPGARCPAARPAVHSCSGTAPMTLWAWWS